MPKCDQCEDAARISFETVKHGGYTWYFYACKAHERNILLNAVTKAMEDKNNPGTVRERTFCPDSPWKHIFN